MSEQGWRAFLSGDGVNDWVVLHGGPTAVLSDRSGNKVDIAARPDGAAAADPGGPS